MSLADKAQEIVEVAQKRVKQAEVIIYKEEEQTRRYLKNNIHQNVFSKNYGVRIKVVIDDRKIGSAAIDSVDMKALSRGIENAISAAKVTRTDKYFSSLPEFKPITPIRGIFSKSTVKADPEKIAEDVKTCIQTAKDFRKEIAWCVGYHHILISRTAVANSLGIKNETAHTEASLLAIVKSRQGDSEGSGYSVKRSRDINEIDPADIGRRAASDAFDSLNPEKLPPGAYDAVLRPEAVASFIDFIGRVGFSAEAYQRGNSPLKGKIGTEVFNEKLSIIDNGRNLRNIDPTPFDGEGVPKKATVLVNRGIAENLCYDTYTANKEGKESTGHAGTKHGVGFWVKTVCPMHQLIQPGDASVEEMIKDTKRGVLITRLWYVNSIRDDLGILTGSTRDGVWFIENGEIKNAIREKRFTDSAVRVLKEIDLLGKASTIERAKSHLMTMNCSTPAMKIRKFVFSN
jgi:PmbA protein